MSTRTITCQDCGAQRSNVQYKTTKYCHGCRLLRSVLWFEGKAVRECADCGGDFAPLGAKDAHCGYCKWHSLYHGHCTICGDHGVDLLRPGVAVCTICVRDPDARADVLEHLQEEQAHRREANGIPRLGGRSPADIEAKRQRRKKATPKPSAASLLHATKGGLDRNAVVAALKAGTTLKAFRDATVCERYPEGVGFTRDGGEAWLFPYVDGRMDTKNRLTVLEV